MLYSFRVEFRGFFADSKFYQKREDKFVPGSAFFGEVFAGIGQENTPVWFRSDETFADESLDCFGNGDLTDA